MAGRDGFGAARGYPLVIEQFAMENCPFIDDMIYLLQHCGFP
jgi:hypothetical protein